MNVLLISQCDKRALTESRRILDQFGERRGDRTWQTAITQDGLDTLRKLLRKTARKNTAVACHWIRGRDHSELLWIVGDGKRFNAEGAVPTNTTERNVLRREDENDWHSAEDICLLAQLAGLLHDLGKASVAFQERLQGKRTERNLYRHEWVSLRLFQAFVGEDDDAGWLQRLGDADRSVPDEWLGQGRYQRDGIDAQERYPFRKLPPLAAAVGWLIVTHHRLPAVPATADEGKKVWWGQRVGRFEQAWLDAPLEHVAHDWNEISADNTAAQAEPYWEPAGELPVFDLQWRKHAARLARRLVDRVQHRDTRADFLGNPYVMHLARLSLMLADHDYSRLGVDDHNRPVTARMGFLQVGQALSANTRKERTGKSVANQSLLEHLLGVGHSAGLVAHALPGFERYLPRLAHHRGLRKRTGDARFAWQDKAFDAAVAIREQAREQGAFVVNMASTGCGKTLGNARILYALADPQRGLRATYALGLRTLTLQTGRSYRHDLRLSDDELAVLVGGSASRALFEFYEDKAEASGSASEQSLIEEDSHVLYEGAISEHPLLSRALADTDIRRLLSAPMLVCTVDHLVPATESLRAGRQIAPMLRLMSADLVLDELDDYDLDDLPALTRLVHWAGLLGTRVVLSSATLPPALVQGMFLAYRAGRSMHLRNRGEAGGDDARMAIPCLWVDEFGVQQTACGGHTEAVDFANTHAEFVQRRVSRLRHPDVAALRRGALWPLSVGARQRGQRERIRAGFAAQVRAACLSLHGTQAETDPVSGKRISLGLVRMANIDPLIDVARELYALGAPDGTRIHLCVYHARFPLAQRSAIEQSLDRTFNRRDPRAQAVYHLPEIRSAIDAHPESEHMFVVLASPVCEVGRDWDADWAVAEPSSMRSLIQLAGRVQRHRRRAGDTPNVVVLETNLKALERSSGDSLAFTRPGFERVSEHFRLQTHTLRKLLADHELKAIDAVPRIQPRAHADRQPRTNLADLEQARIEASALPRSGSAMTSGSAPERDEAAPAWQYPQASLTGVLQQRQPFRDDSQRKATLVFLPDDDEETLDAHRVEEDRSRRGASIYLSAADMLARISLHAAPGISPWGAIDEHALLALLSEHAQSLDLSLLATARKLSTVEVPYSEQGWRWHPWLGFTPRA
jgi:CRISPR-associated endonuclease/helicase Cas3